MQQMSYKPTADDHGERASRGNSTSRHRGLAVVAGLIALSAYGGALGLATGFLNLGNTVASRLPFHSPVLGGLALVAVVAVPTTVLAWQAARGQRTSGDVSIVAGVLLAGWILVELALIGELELLPSGLPRPGRPVDLDGHPHPHARSGQRSDRQRRRMTGQRALIRGAVTAGWPRPYAPRMGWPASADDLLAGPRGRRMCWSVVNPRTRDLVLDGPCWLRVWHGGNADPAGLATELAAAVALTDLDAVVAELPRSRCWPRSPSQWMPRCTGKGRMLRMRP